MMKIGAADPEVINSEWVTFPGGELEGRRPKALCAFCRQSSTEAGNRRRTLCFECYRVELNRERALKAAGDLNTASEVRFQSALPLEPVDVLRLERLRGERARSRMAQAAQAPYADKRHRAQIAARHALQRIASGLRAGGAVPGLDVTDVEKSRIIAAAVHAAELQLPESWLPFVVAR